MSTIFRFPFSPQIPSEKGKKKGGRKTSRGIDTTRAIKRRISVIFLTPIAPNKSIRVQLMSSYHKEYGVPTSLICHGDEKNASNAVGPWKAADVGDLTFPHPYHSSALGQRATFAHYRPGWGHPGAKPCFLLPLIAPQGAASLNIDMKLQLLSGSNHSQSPFYWVDSVPALAGRKTLCSACGESPPHLRGILKN